ncbi:pseudouridine synthase [Inquilinus limosus]|uniref:Pseudouridine synthase n=1 Tax=Inquilinus limosus TaxID=171674 RepID=A0A211ZM87_9PROT|nr:pseudouridine synthase [Inquilinus limosus]OWJ66398.1 16S rRNA pseudouridine(516) synthase [Inquilinus limosus]
MKLVRRLANLGYGSRRQVEALLRDGRVTDAGSAPLDAEAQPEHEAIRVDGQPLDPPPGAVLMLHKPAGFTCSTSDPGRVVYELLPPRFRLRNPIIAPVGRLDRDTTGLLLLTDDGPLLHRIISPKSRILKVYEATLARDLSGEEAAAFASGTLMLRSETTPLEPAVLEPLGPRKARLAVTEGRYHQVRRMFAAVGNHVEALHRSAVGGLALGDLAEGKWRLLDPAEVSSVFNSVGP